MESPANEPRRCPRCGGPEAPASPLGLAGVCASCLAQSLLAADTPFAESPSAARPPRQLGDYELIREIARGGMGVVYLGRQSSLHRTVAVKLLLPGLASNPARLARFRAEATLAARLQHPNIVAIHEIGEHEGVPYFSMEHVDGRDLGRLVRDRLPPPQQAARLAREVARAIEYAHGRGVLHRDLKPSNVLVTRSGEPRVTDFGLAKPLDPDCELTLSGEVLGSPSFMAPEQAAGRRADVDVRTDVYGLGGLLYYALTGRPPFVADSVSATLQRVMEGGPVPPGVLQPGVPTDLQTIVMRCLARDRRHRYPSAGAVADELDRFLRGAPIHARPPIPVERLWRWARREPTLAGLMATATVLCVVVVGAALMIARQREMARRRDVQRRAAAEMQRYVSDVTSAGLAIAEGRIHSALEMLDGLRPAPGEPDARGFEWHWLRARTSESAHESWWQGPEPVNALAWSGDGRRLALVHERSVRVVSAGGGRVFAEHAVPGPTTPLGGAFSRDGRYLFLVDGLGLRRMELTVGRTDTLLGEPLDGVEASPDGRWLAVRTAAVNGRRESQDVLLLDPETGEVRENLEGLGGPCLAWIADGSLRGVASDGRLWGWGATGGRRELGGPMGGMPVAGAFSADGAQCVVLWPDGTMRWRDGLTGAVRMERRGRPQRGVRLAFSPDGRGLAVVGGTDERVVLLSAVDGSPLQRWTAHTDQVTAVGFTADGHRLVTAGRDGTVRAWDPAGPASSTRWEHRCRTLPSHAVQFSGDGRWVAALRRKDSGEESALWSAADPEARPMALPGRPMGFSPDGKFVLQWESGGNLRLWDLTNGTETVSFRLNPQPSEQPDLLSPDGRFFTCLTWRRRLLVVHAETTEELPAPVARVQRMVVSPDSEWIGYVAGETVGCFRVADGESFEVTCPGATELAFSPDARFLSAGHVSGRVYVVDVGGHRMVAELPGHSAAVTALAFSPDGRSLVTAGEDTMVRWWHVPAWRELAHLPQPTVAHQLRYSPDGRALLVGVEREYRMLTAGGPVGRGTPAAAAGFWTDPVGLGWRLARRSGMTGR